MNVILGPGRCQLCGRPVWWGTGARVHVAAWRNADGKRHGPSQGCAKTTRGEAYNDVVATRA